MYRQLTGGALPSLVRSKAEIILLEPEAVKTGVGSVREAMAAKTFDIAILGGGVMGLTSACALARHGHRVHIFDPASAPSPKSASHIAGGMLAPWAEIEHMPQGWIEAGLAGISLWKEFSRTHATGFAQNGSLLIAHNEDRYILERFKSHLPAEKQAAHKPQDLEPALPEKFASGVYLEEEAHLNPALTLAALCNELTASGASFHLKATQPETIQGDYDYIIDARGIAGSDNEPALRAVKGETLVVRNPEFTLSRPLRLMHPRYPLYIVPRGDGVFMIGATQVESEGAHVTLRSGLELMSALYSLHPSFGEAEILEINAGLRPAYPDNLPRITIKGNVIRANGLFRHGFLLSPVMAECIADYVAGRAHKYMELFKGKSNENNNQRKTAKLHRAA